MFAHPLFQNSDSETASDSTDDQIEQDIELEMEKIAFAERVQTDVSNLKILEDHIETAFKFYMLKMIRTFLNQKFILQYLK